MSCRKLSLGALWATWLIQAVYQSRVTSIDSAQISAKRIKP